MSINLCENYFPSIVCTPKHSCGIVSQSDLLYGSVDFFSCMSVGLGTLFGLLSLGFSLKKKMFFLVSILKYRGTRRFLRFHCSSLNKFAKPIWGQAVYNC